MTSSDPQTPADTGGWPALGYEDAKWTPTTARAWDGTDASSRGSLRYRPAVPPSIARLEPHPAPEVLVAAEEAARELSRFDRELRERIDAVAPVLLLCEAAASSQIENQPASARAIMSGRLGAQVGRSAELVAAGTRSTQRAIDLARDLGPTAIRDVHRVLLAEQPRRSPGEWRQEAVWIGPRADSPLGADFVAPVFARVPGLIDDLTGFAGRWDTDPLVSVAVSYAQFETVRPFTDGNGRTGRALVQSLLRRRGVTRAVVVPVSAGLLADLDGSRAALTAYRRGDIDPVVRSFADASLRAVRNARLLVAQLDGIRGSWNGRLEARRDSVPGPLLDLLARRPVIDAATAAAELGSSVPDLPLALRTLVSAGIATTRTEPRVGPLWRSDEILAAIDAFAARAGRRSA